VSVPVALVGCGAWGQNLLRVLHESRHAELCAVADTSPARREAVRAKVPGVAVVERLEEVALLGARAVVIATPPRTHAPLVLAALEAGLDVFVEKPLALSVADAERCLSRAEELGRIAMVGHLLRYHPAVERLVAMAHEGELGAIRRLSASRLSIRGDRSVSALWSLGPHDLSVVHALEPLRIGALSATSGPEGDPVVLAFSTASGIAARIELSSMHSTKVRRILVVGTKGAVMFDDVRAPDRIFVSRSSRQEDFFEGPVDEVHVAWREPIAIELEHFLRCVEERSRPRTSFEEGSLVVRALVDAERALVDADLNAPRRAAGS